MRTCTCDVTTVGCLEQNSSPFPMHFHNHPFRNDYVSPTRMVVIKDAIDFFHVGCLLDLCEKCINGGLCHDTIILAGCEHISQFYLLRIFGFAAPAPLATLRVGMWINLNVTISSSYIISYVSAFCTIDCLLPLVVKP
jgi:hypothetical protein